MLTIHIERTSGDSEWTFGRLWIDGETTFRCNTTELPSLEHSGLDESYCALPLGKRVLRITMDGLNYVPTVDVNGKYSSAKILDCSLNELQAYGLGSIRIWTQRPMSRSLGEVLTEYIKRQQYAGRMRLPKPRRGEFLLEITEAEDFRYIKKEKPKIEIPEDEFDFSDDGYFDDDI